jgi:O-methyltransferase
VYVACWAASHARHLAGSFVECGVNTGIFSLAVCRYVDFNTLDKDFYLFDTFSGIPESQMLEDERVRWHDLNAQLYSECFDLARQNFSPYPRARLIRGVVPDTLETVEIDRVCYLSIDMTIVKPERAALEHFWDKLVPGAVVLLHNYGWQGYEQSKQGLDEFAGQVGVEIFTCPTGQGILLRP